MLAPETGSLQVQGVEGIRSLLAQPDFSFKMVLNESGALIFPKEIQHSSMKSADGSISYFDDYKGNALAAMVRKGAIEIRYHRDFSDLRVAALLKKLLRHPDLQFARGWQISYQGRPVSI